MRARRTLALLLILIFSLHRPLCAQTTGIDRPNILWISCEDLSPMLGCYGDQTATTPNLDKLASEGTLFTHAFSCHGVCAPSRTGIITGVHPISLGANHMRSKVRLPSHIRLFPALLRDAGYFCTNNSKTDYNLEWSPDGVWDMNSGKAHWKSRKEASQPFFAVFNLTMTHESKVWPSGWKDVVTSLEEAARHRPENMVVPKIFPDTQAVREDLARLADLATVMDQRVGELLAELEQAGLADNTIVFFWSDHGNGLPRCKRWTYDSGSRVPLIVRVPAKWQGKTGGVLPGRRDDRLVSLLDLAPTVLSLAGVQPPEHFHGRSLFSVQEPERKFVHGARDRLDERFDLVRTVRTRQYRYVRNLMPWRPALQHVAYGEQNETLKEMRRLLALGELPESSAQWFTSPRSAEELYDLEADPWETENLAGSDRHQEILRDLRNECTRWQLDVRDAHLVPECMLRAEEEKAGTRWDIFRGADGESRLNRILQAAVRTSQLSAEDANGLAKGLSDDPVERWWQMTLIAKAAGVADRSETLRSELQSTNAALRLAAAAGLSGTTMKETGAEEFRRLLRETEEFLLHATLVELDDTSEEFRQTLTDALPVDSTGEYVQRLVTHLKPAAGKVPADEKAPSRRKGKPAGK